MSLEQSKSTAKNLVVGGAAGAIEAIIMYPTEFVKTQLQLDARAAKGAGAKPKYTGVVNCAVVTVRERGPLALYRGLSTLVAGSIPKAAVRFAAFEQLTRALKDENGKMSATRSMLAGFGAGLIEAAVAVTPMETVKTKLIDDQNKPQPKYRGLVHGVRTIVAEEGLGGVYRGLTPTMLKQGCNQMVRFTIFNELKALAADGGRRKPASWETPLYGSIAGFVSVYATMPFDVVKTRMQGLEASQYRNALDCFRKIVSSEGTLALWRGTTPRLGRVMCSGAIIFTAYEQVMQLVAPVWPEPRA